MITLLKKEEKEDKGELHMITVPGFQEQYDQIDPGILRTLSQMNDPDISSSDSEDKNSSEELNSQVPKWKVQMACST